MTRAERVAAVKLAVAASMVAAQRAGWTIVCEIDRVGRDDGAGGCCALASLDITKADRVPFHSDGDEMAREWDSIEMGFDGVPVGNAVCQDGTPVLPDFWLLGAELREQYQPLPVDVFLAPQVAREEAARAARMALVRFT